MADSKMILGFAAAVVIGGGAGAGLNMASGALVHAPPAPNAPIDLDPLVTVKEVNGEVLVWGVDGSWRPLHSGESIPRPVAIRTPGAESSARFSLQGTEVSLSDNAELFIGSAIDGWLQLDAGQVLIQRRGRPLITAVPTRSLEISGTSYALRAHGGRVVLAVLDGDAEVKRGADPEQKFGRGREIIITDKQLTPVAIEAKLEINVSGVTKVGKRVTIVGKTAAGARLMVSRGDHWEEIDLSPVGGFTVELDSDIPPEKALMAVDTLGRRAFPKNPSSTLDEMRARLGGEAAAPPVEAPPPEEAKPEPPPPAAKVEPPPPPPAKVEPPPPAKVEPPPPPAKVEPPKPVKVEPPPVKEPKVKEPKVPKQPKEPPIVKAEPKKPPPPKKKEPSEEDLEVTDDEDDPPPPPSRPPPKAEPKHDDSDDEAGGVDEDQL